VEFKPKQILTGNTVQQFTQHLSTKI